MKKFKFRLEKVLRYKKRLYDLALAKHGEAMQKRRKEEVLLEGLRKQYRECLFDLSQRTVDIFHIKDLGPYYRFMTFTKKEITHQTKVLIEALDEEERLRTQLMERAKEKEALERLREKKLKEYKEYVQKEEQKFLDDITTSKFVREARSV